MKTTRRLPAAPTPAQQAAQQHEHARQQLRVFAKFIETQDPATLAALATDVDGTLESCATIEAFFKAYVMALCRRRVH